MLLKRSSLVLLDECTASVDVPTAQLMREVLSQQVEGEHTAVIQIAHDLGAIRGYDRVLVMAGGEVVEEGAPRVLEQQSSSHFRQLLLRAHY
jgi:ABC-type multidrug transport system fused ATPase/permease subunit